MTMRENAAKLIASRWTPLLPIVLGLLLLTWLLAHTKPGYHFVCDSALKEYNLWLWQYNDSISNNLTMPGAPDWAREIWSHDYFPIQTPFEFERHIVFPPFFQLISYPLWRAFGYYGLFALPSISILGLWALIWRFWERNGLGGFPALVGMSLLALSPLTFYGAMFWEHAPVIFLFMFGFLAVIESSETSINAALSSRERFCRVLGGIAIVGAQVMRPELIFGTLIVCFIAMCLSRSRLSFLAGIVPAGLLCAAINFLSTGSFIGLHHQQERFLVRGDWPQNLLEYYATNAMDFLTQSPAVMLAIVSSMLLFKKQLSARIERAALLAIITLSFLLLILILPNLGGFQIYRRYFLLIIPIGAILAARLTCHRTWMGLALLGLHALSLPLLMPLMDEFAWSFNERVKPLVGEIESAPPVAIISVTNDGVLDLIPRMSQVPFFQVHSEEGMLDLVEKLQPHAAPEDIAFIFVHHADDPMRATRTLTLRDGRTYALKKFNNGRSIYYLFRLIPSDNTDAVTAKPTEP